jgi:hypothetical protein
MPSSRWEDHAHESEVGLDQTCEVSENLAGLDIHPTLTVRSSNLHTPGIYYGHKITLRRYVDVEA